MTFPPTGFLPLPCRQRIRAAAACFAASVLVVACGSPPPPAPEPTGEDREQAWRIAVGTDPLDRTVAQLYAKALNAHDTPAVVVEDTGEEITELAVSLARGEGEGEDAQEAENSDTDGDHDQHYEIVLARTMPLARALSPEEYADLTAPGDQGGFTAAAAPEELIELIQDSMNHAELFTPAEAVMGSVLLLTSVGEEELEFDGDDDLTMESLEGQCEDLRIGINSELPNPLALLEELYDCSPEEIRTDSEQELLSQLISAEVDAVVMTGSHPGVQENALSVLADTQRAFPQDQYAPVVAERIAQDAPEVIDEISESLNDEALLLLRRLIHGENALSPEEAAEYWLVENGVVAEPESWG